MEGTMVGGGGGKRGGDLWLDQMVDFGSDA